MATRHVITWRAAWPTRPYDGERRKAASRDRRGRVVGGRAECVGAAQCEEDAQGGRKRAALRRVYGVAGPALRVGFSLTSLSPCGHIFCAKCLVSWFSVELHVNEDDEQRGNVRRKKVCPSCRTQVVTPPLELWALKGVLDALRDRMGAQQDTPFIQQGLWEGLFDPATFYHVIRDEDDDVLRCGMCSSEILEGQFNASGIRYEDLTDEEEAWHRADAVNIESEEEADDSDEEGSLQDFVVDDDDAESQASYESPTSSIVCVSPPAESDRARPTDAASRKSRLQELVASRARKHGAAHRMRPVFETSQSEQDSASDMPSETLEVTDASDASDAESTSE